MCMLRFAPVQRKLRDAVLCTLMWRRGGGRPRPRPVQEVSAKPLTRLLGLTRASARSLIITGCCSEPGGFVRKRLSVLGGGGWGDGSAET